MRHAHVSLAGVDFGSVDNEVLSQDNLEFGAETMTSLEAGLRTTSADGRLRTDFGAFVARRDDQQVKVPFQLRLGDPSSVGDDDRFSTILIAVGVAMIAASIVVGDPRWLHYGVAAALFPLLVGTALWLRLFIQRRAQRASRQ